MNLRTLTLKYLGWCPGVDSAARFIPDREINGTRASVGTLYDIGTIINFPLFSLVLSGDAPHLMVNLAMLGVGTAELIVTAFIILIIFIVRKLVTFRR